MYKIFAILSLLSANTFAGVPTFDQCLEGTEIIGHVVQDRIAGVPYEEVYQNVQLTLEAIPKMLPQEKWFLHDMHDTIEFDEWVDQAYNSKDSIDQVETNYLNACLDRIVYR